MPYNFDADSFHTKKLVAEFLQAKCDFRTYDDHLRLIGKRVVDFLLVLIELFR